ncbi:uncharacterized protein LOC128225799 [Mya arenaria]|uniref:uncharacterized protein LOC128225799 n=1 Tax=Mya arenaria TaxID=6604 RepID=UPI0022E2AE25|nr:uncharacterized protein LOC128225799 [Mya arenaria]
MSEEENTHFHNNFDESAEATQGHASASPIQNEPVSNPHCQTSETLQQNNDVEVPQDKTSIPITSNEQVGSQHSAQPLGSTTKPITERFYIDMFEEDIAVVREEHKLFRKYCIMKDLKIKSCLQEALNEETEGGLTDDRLKKRDTAMKKLTQAFKSYLRRCSRVRGMIDILEKHCQQANGLRGNAECSKVAMTLEKDLDLFKELYRVKNEKLKKHEIEIAQEEFKKQRSFVNEIYRLQKQEILLDEQLKATEANLDYYAKKLDEENLKVNGLEAKFKETNDSLSEIKEKDMRNQECRDEKNKIIMQLKKELQAAESTSSKQLQDLQTQKTYTYHWHNQFQQQLLNAQECTWKFEKSQTVCRELEREKNSLVLRLSKIAGDNLAYKNPNIADLGDPRRPTKLAEVYNELYDNEWTDAFDRFGDFTDTEKVQRMLTILKVWFNR